MVLDSDEQDNDEQHTVGPENDQQNCEARVTDVQVSDVQVGAVRVETPEAMAEFGVQLAGHLRAGDLVVLSGPLGAGKTTLVRGIGEGLGVRGPVTSPTFVLARTHPSLVGGAPLVHVDAYRLGSAVELDDLDIDFAGSVVVVEWGAGMLDGVAESWLDVRIERPVGATVAPGVAASVSSDDDADTTDAHPGAGAGAGADADDDFGEEPVEPRTVTMIAVGPRWAGVDPAGDYA